MSQGSGGLQFGSKDGGRDKNEHEVLQRRNEKKVESLPNSAVGEKSIEATLSESMAGLSRAGRSSVLNPNRTSSSSSLFAFFPKRRSNEQKKLLLNRSRAHDMCASLELSENRCTELSKMLHNTSVAHRRAPSFTGTPRFAASLSTKQAVEAFSVQERARKEENLSTSQNPLLSDRERKAVERKREIDRRKDSIRSRLSPASQLTAAPSFSRGGDEKKVFGVSKKGIELYETAGSRSWHLKDKKPKTKPCGKATQPLNRMAMALPSPGSYSVAPTEPSTPSPRPCTSQSTQGASSKAPRFSLPSHPLC
jgi:hypothetical protein